MLDSQINFCHTQIDPRGMPTSGNTRTYADVDVFITPSSLGSDIIEVMKFDSLEVVAPWDVNLYFNSGVVMNLTSFNAF